ncbi:MAG: hypothetical protein Q7R42_06035 [Candidatus Planktophila sp.]|nr:hypothetical protein [Candidatus Planktophila sp.]
MTETAQELRDQAAELLRRSIALDRADGAPGMTDELSDFTKKLFAPDEDDTAFNQLNRGEK